MSNIYEALEQACKKTGSGITPELSLQTEVIRGVSLAPEMTWLHHQVDAVLSDTSRNLSTAQQSIHLSGTATAAAPKVATPLPAPGGKH